MVEKINTKLFLDNLPKDCTTREIIKKISRLDIDKNESQKRYIENLDAQSAVLKLVTLGYRKEAKKIALHCYQNSSQNFNLKFAREMAEFLMNHEFKFGSLSEAIEWERHYLDLDKTIRAQARAKRMYGIVLNNYMMGLTLPKEDIMRMVRNLEENIKYDSVWYLYYYYQIKSLLFEGKGLENMILKAISVFEKRYIKHSNFVVIFKMELINYYKDNKDFDRALKVVKETLSITSKDTIPFLNIEFIQIEIITDMGNYEYAISNYQKAIERPLYKSFPLEQKMKWQLLHKRIIEEEKNWNDNN